MSGPLRATAGATRMVYTTIFSHVFLAGWPKSFFLSFLHVLRSKWLRSTFDGDLEEKIGWPKVVVSTAVFHAKVRGSVPGIGSLKEKKVSSPSTCETQYCGEPP